MVELSIIIPVYNVERYLAKCLDSVLVGNAFTGQVICVNDGSTDNSAAILEEYTKQYPNVEIITQVNSGLSAARNAGIKAAKGDYICFLDSDDYWEPKVLSGLMAQVERDRLDVLRFKYQNVNEQYEVFNPNKGDPYKGNDYSAVPTDGVSFLNSRFGTACYAVLFILRRELLKDCLFTEGIYFEDTDWTPRMLAKADRVASADTIVYNYLIRKGSITQAVDSSKKKKVLEDKLRLIKTLQQQAIDLKKCGRNNRWYRDMISDTVVSIIGMLSTTFHVEKDAYLAQLQQLHIYPLQPKSFKARLINISPRLFVGLLHIKNKK